MINLEHLFIAIYFCVGGIHKSESFQSNNLQKTILHDSLTLI